MRRGAALEQLARHARASGLADGEARPQSLLEKALEERRHVAQPEREEDHQVLAPGDRLLRCADRRHGLPILPFVGAAQQRETEPPHIDRVELVARVVRVSRVGVAERVAEVAAARIGMALDDSDSHRHSLRVRLKTDLTLVNHPDRDGFKMWA